jgi:hypothetical protein
MNGIIIAKEGANVGSNSSELYVDTRTPLFKLFKADKGERIYVNRDMRFGFANDSFVIPHNLGYIPMFFLYMDRSGQADRKIVTNLDAVSVSGSVLVTCFIDKQNINVYVSSAFSTLINGTFGYNYFIFYDKVG